MSNHNPEFVYWGRTNRLNSLFWQLIQEGLYVTAMCLPLVREAAVLIYADRNVRRLREDWPFFSQVILGTSDTAECAFFRAARVFDLFMQFREELAELPWLTARFRAELENFEFPRASQMAVVEFLDLVRERVTL